MEATPSPAHSPGNQRDLGLGGRGALPEQTESAVLPSTAIATPSSATSPDIRWSLELGGRGASIDIASAVSDLETTRSESRSSSPSKLESRQPPLSCLRLEEDEEYHDVLSTVAEGETAVGAASPPNTHQRETYTRSQTTCLSEPDWAPQRARKRFPGTVPQRTACHMDEVGMKTSQKFAQVMDALKLVGSETKLCEQLALNLFNFVGPLGR